MTEVQHDHDWVAIEQMQIDIGYLTERLKRAEDVIRDMYQCELVPFATLLDYVSDYNFKVKADD